MASVLVVLTLIQLSVSAWREREAAR
jgi:hypothetical protein